MREFAPRLYRYALVRLGRAEHAEEAVAEALARLIERGPDLAGEIRHVHGWLVRCLVNVCREMERRPRSSRDLALPLAASSGSALEADDARELRRALAQLPPRQREAVTLRILMEHSVAETAEAMACAPGTVKALTHQGLASLHARLNPALRLLVMGVA